ncbi:MAG: phage minor head protein [Pseudohongiellaceae bacterium]
MSKNQDKWELFTQEYVGQFGGQKIVEITETTRQQVLSGIAIGRRDGVGQRDIAKRIMGQAPSIGRQRAAVIARTETHSAGNYGALKQAEDTGLQMQKEWLAAEGARTRESHNAANGQVVMMNEPFIVGGHEMQYPGDPSGPASETVNCRCSQGFIVMD